MESPFRPDSRATVLFKTLVQEKKKMTYKELGAMFPDVDKKSTSSLIGNFMSECTAKGYLIEARKDNGPDMPVVVQFVKEVPKSLTQWERTKAKFGKNGYKKPDQAPQKVEKKKEEQPLVITTQVSPSTDILAERFNALQRTLNMRVSENPAFILEAVARMDNLIIQLLGSK